MEPSSPHRSPAAISDLAAAPVERHRLEPFGVAAAALGFEEVVARVMRWTRDPGQGRFVCLANVHMLIEATRHRRVSRALDRADLVLTDGMPLVWLMSKQTRAACRIAGMDLFPALCRAAAEQEVPVFFVGSTDECLRAVRSRLEREHPRLRIAGMQPATIGRLSRVERRDVGAGIHRSGARLVFVALGCPRQELWMDRHRDSLGAVLVGVGGAVDVYAGLRKRAPRALQARGLEWIYRLGQEPLRLWRRYLVTNSTFLWLLLRHRLWGRSGG